MTIRIKIGNERKARYVFDAIFSICRASHEYDTASNDNITLGDITITYSKEVPKIRGKHIHIVKSDFWDHYKKPESMPKTPLKHYKELPVLYGEPRISYKKDIVIIHFDIIASIFFMLTRYEEYMQPEIKDKYDRFPAKASLAFKQGFLDRPIVNEYIELLFSLMKKLEPAIKREWTKFEIFVTHDVDFMFLYNKLPLKTLAGDIIRRKSLNLVVERIKNYSRVKQDYEKDPYYKMIKHFLEKERELKSAFYFLTGEADEGKRYNVNDSRVVRLIKEIQKNKTEIGLHGSFNSYNDLAQLKREKRILENILKIKDCSIRQHFLRFDIRKTWQIQNKLGFKYDTTCGFADHEGFRCGVCHPFNVYDLVADCQLKIKEIPLIVMDGTLMGYRKLTSKEASKIIFYYKNECKKYLGIFTILWHNSLLSNNYDWKKAYDHFIGYID